MLISIETFRTCDIPRLLDPRILTLDLLITSTYISDHAIYLNKRPVYTILTNKFYQQKRFRSVSFFSFYHLKDFYAIKTYIEFTESSTRNSQAYKRCSLAIWFWVTDIKHQGIVSKLGMD